MSVNIVKKDNEKLNKKYIDIDKVINKQKDLEDEGLEKCLKEMKSPYCFICEDVVVRLKFSDSENTLDLCLISYFKNLKNC